MSKFARNRLPQSVLNGRKPCFLLALGGLVSAPEKNEDREGKIFIGPSGKVLDELLRMANIDACHLNQSCTKFMIRFLGLLIEKYSLYSILLQCYIILPLKRK